MHWRGRCLVWSHCFYSFNSFPRSTPGFTKEPFICVHGWFDIHPSPPTCRTASPSTMVSECECHLLFSVFVSFTEWDKEIVGLHANSWQVSFYLPLTGFIVGKTKFCARAWHTHTHTLQLFHHLITLAVSWEEETLMVSGQEVNTFKFPHGSPLSLFPMPSHTVHFAMLPSNVKNTILMPFQWAWERANILTISPFSRYNLWVFIVEI